MVKITALPLAGPLTGEEATPLVQDGITRQVIAADHMAYLATGAQLARDQAADLVLPENIFIDVPLATAEAALADGTNFKLVDSATGIAQVRKRTALGSDLLYEEMTVAALDPLLAKKVEYPRTAREIAAAVVPFNVLKPEHNLLRYGAKEDARAAFLKAYATMTGANSTYPPGDPQYNTRGRGTIILDKEQFDFGADTLALAGVYGLVVQGQGIWASGMNCNRIAGPAIEVTTYLGLTFRDGSLTNRSADRGTSIGILLHPNNGGQALNIDNWEFRNFHVAVEIDGIQNGDTSTFVRTVFHLETNDIGFHIAGNNRQAIVHTFLQPIAGCSQAFIRTTGSGEIVVLGMNGVMGESILQFSNEAGGNACNFLIDAAKMEYGYGPIARAMLFIDDREGTVYGGRGAQVAIRNVNLEGGHYQPADRDAHVIARLGRKLWRLMVTASKFPGTINLDATGVNYAGIDWTFRDNPTCPKNFNLTGTNGPHLVFEGNQNVPDHRRWGQQGVRSGDIAKEVNFRNPTSTFLNTGLGGQNNTGGRFGARYGYEVAFATGLPDGCDLLGFFVKIVAYGGAGDTMVEFCTADFLTVLASITIPAGNKQRHRVDIASPYPVIANGIVNMRLTAPAINHSRTGIVAPIYHPYAMPAI